MNWRFLKSHSPSTRGLADDHRETIFRVYNQNKFNHLKIYLLSFCAVLLLSSCRLSNAIDGSLGSIIPDPPLPLQPKAALVATDGVARNINAFHMTLSLNFSDVTLTPANFKITNGAAISGFTQVNATDYAFTVTAAQEGTMNLSLLLAYTSKDNLSLNPPTLTLNYDITPPATPSFLSLTNSVSPSSNRQPYVRVSPTSVGDSIYIYLDSACTTGNKIGLNSAFTTYADVRLDLLPIDGHYTLYAQAVDPAGNKSGCSPQFIAYDLTTGLAATPTLAFASPATNATTVPVNLSWIDGKEVAFYSNATCDGPAAWEPFISSKNRVIGPADGSYPVSALMKSVRDGSTVCKTTSILLDRTPPGQPGSIGFTQVLTDFTKTPILDYYGGTDNAGGSGIAGYQIQLAKFAADGVSFESTSAWTTAAPSGQKTAISSSPMSDYEVRIRSVDVAGNVSATYVTAGPVLKTPPAPNPDSTHCPTNFVPVPAVTNVLEPPDVRAIPQFCVAKYEISCPSASSLANGEVDPGTCTISSAGPFQGSFPAARHAQAACQGMGYDLISNLQWQVLGSAIEYESLNWAGGGTNNGAINNGFAIDSPVVGPGEWISANPPTSASTDDNVGCYGDNPTLTSVCSLRTWNSRRRVHRLSNGYYVWDIAGTNSEWVSGSLADYFAIVPYDTGQLYIDIGSGIFVSSADILGDRRNLFARATGIVTGQDSGGGVIQDECYTAFSDCSLLRGGGSSWLIPSKSLAGGIYSLLLYPTYHGANFTALASWHIVGTARCVAPYTP